MNLFSDSDGDGGDRGVPPLPPIVNPPSLAGGKQSPTDSQLHNNQFNDPSSSDSSYVGRESSSPPVMATSVATAPSPTTGEMLLAASGYLPHPAVARASGSQLAPTMYIPQPSPEKRSASIQKTTSPKKPSASIRQPTITESLNDPDNYLDHETYFGNLQDDGIAFPAKYVEQLKTNPTKKWSRYYRQGNRLYPKIWTIASDMYKHILFPRQEVICPKINKQSSKPIQFISAWIFEHRFTKLIGDLAAESDESNSQMKYIRLPKYCELEHIHFLPQRDVLKFCLDKWGRTMDDLMKVAEDDRLRAMGIIFSEDMYQYILYFLTARDPTTAHTGDRTHVDEWNGKKKLAGHLLYLRFIDNEVQVALPKEWTSEEAKKMIDDHHNETGVYDSLLYNPNNPDRIKLPWKEEDAVGIVSTTLVVYKAMMEMYKSGTGGGSGNPVAYSVWQNRGALHSVTYNQSRAWIYLSIVHIWDKSKNWPLMYSKGTVPLGVAIDDNLNPTSTPSSAPRSSKDQQVFLEGIEAQMKSRQDGFQRATNDVISSIKSFAGSSKEEELSQTDKQIQLQKAIESTTSQLETFEGQRQDLTQLKRMIPKDTRSPTKQKRPKKLSNSMKIKDELISQYNSTLKIHMKNLGAVNGYTKGKSDDSSDSDSDSD